MASKKVDFTFSYIRFDKPKYYKLYGVFEFPVEFHAYLKPTSIGRFKGNLYYDGEKSDLTCELQESSAKVTFHEKRERKSKMAEVLLESDEFLEVKDEMKRIIEMAGGSFQKTVDKWQRRINKMLEYDKVYTMVAFSSEAREFILNSRLTYAKRGEQNKPVLVFRHPEIDWTLLFFHDEHVGIRNYRKFKNDEERNIWRKHLKDGDARAISRFIEKEYIKMGRRAAEDILSAIAGHCLSESLNNTDLYPSLVKRRLIRTLMK